jgi:predicted PurR-regulated permease PerM
VSDLPVSSSTNGSETAPATAGPGPSSSTDAAKALPNVLRVTAALSWRGLVIAFAVYYLAVTLNTLSLVVIPVAIALLLAALLSPAVALLTRIRVPRSLATVIVLVGGIAVVGSVFTLVINAFIAGFDSLQAQIMNSLVALHHWLSEGPLHLRDEQISAYLLQAQNWLEANQSMLTNRLVSTASTFGRFVTGLALMLFTLIFFLHDGRKIWLFLIKAVPADVRDRIDVAGLRAFASLVGYVRATALVAVGDALGIGIGLTVVGVPLAIPLAALVFLGAFVPVVGAVTSGSVAVVIALVTKGWVTALLTVAVVLIVQQIEGNVLQPLLLGRAVKLHALAVVLAISAGAVIYGIVGAVLAVPLTAVLNSAIRSLAHGEDSPEEVNPLRVEHSKPPAKDAEAAKRGKTAQEADRTLPAADSDEE